MLQTELTNELTDAQIIALEAMLGGDNITESAAKAGVHRTTVSKWVNHDFNFRAALRESQAAALESALSVIQEQSTAVAKRLIDIALSPDSGKRDAVQAGSKALDIAVRSIDADEIDAKIDAIERQLKEHASFETY